MENWEKQTPRRTLKRITLTIKDSKTVEAAISEEVTWVVETFEQQPRDEQAPGARARLRQWWIFLFLFFFGIVWWYGRDSTFNPFNVDD
jgi:hypothetical protein